MKTFVISLAIVFGMMKNIQAQNVSVTVRLNQVYCHKTTDAGHNDEVYAIVATRDHLGNHSSLVLPKDLYGFDNWDLSDKGHAEQHLDPRYTRPTGIWNRPKVTFLNIPDGASVELSVVFMEDDGGDDAQRYARAARLVNKLSSGDTSIGAISAAIADLMELYSAVNQDDLLGALSVRLTNNSGTISCEWKPLDKASYTGEGESGLPWGKKFSFVPPGEGHVYYTYWSVVTGSNPESDQPSDLVNCLPAHP